MKISVLYSSPRPKGNSATMAERFLGHAEGAGISRFYLNDRQITECQACGGCAEDCRCSIEDDMQQIYESIEESEIIVMSSPLYWWSISANLKKVIDRLYVYIGKGCLDGKKLVLLVSGISEIPNSGYEMIDGMFKEISGYLKMQYQGCFVSADDSRPVKDNPQILREIDQLAAEVLQF